MGLAFLARRYSAEKRPGGERQASLRERRKTRSPGSRTFALAKTICLPVAGPRYLPSAHTTFLQRTTQLLTSNRAPRLRLERPHRAAGTCHGSLGYCEFYLASWTLVWLPVRRNGDQVDGLEKRLEVRSPNGVSQSDVCDCP